MGSGKKILLFARARKKEGKVRRRLPPLPIRGIVNWKNFSCPILLLGLQSVTTICAWPREKPGGEDGQALIFPYSVVRTLKTESPLVLNHRGPRALAVQDRVLLILSPEKGLELFSLLNPADPVPGVIWNLEVGQLLDISLPFLGITQPRLGLLFLS